MAFKANGSITITVTYTSQGALLLTIFSQIYLTSQPNNVIALFAILGGCWQWYCMHNNGVGTCRNLDEYFLHNPATSFLSAQIPPAVVPGYILFQHC